MLAGSSSTTSAWGRCPQLSAERYGPPGCGPAACSSPLHIALDGCPSAGGLRSLHPQTHTVYLFHFSTSPRLAAALCRRVQSHPRSKGGQYQNAGAGAGFMAIHFADTPFLKTPGMSKRKIGASRPRKNRRRSAPFNAI